MPALLRNQSQLLGERIKEAIKPIKSIIGVFSGKGGVGKTTIAVNLAATLASQGSRVGLLDADVDCPNVHQALGIDQSVRLNGHKIVPIEKFGIRVISMAGMQDSKTTAIIWRGPLITSALYKMIASTEWGELDYLVVDLPPGTSDAPLTIMQTLKPSLIVIAATPQPIAQTDAKKSINMAKAMGIPTALLENMTGDFFGHAHGQELADSLEIPYLGEIGLNKSIREATDHGKPIVLSSEEQKKKFAVITQKIKALITQHN